jgi:hypothetical protein
MWNWIKITEKNDNLPPFKKPVVLYWKNEGKKYAIVGSLKSIDAEGPHWSSTNSSKISIFEFFDLVVQDREFKPTHYCLIEPPEDDDKKENYPDQD